MVIYGNNLHEKLRGIAYSKDYIKYATPFCDFVDDPELGPDIDLAVNFTQAENGDTDAATRFTNTLILSGYLFDWSTKNFYRDKMINNPNVWGGEILRTNRAFSSGNGVNNGFGNAFEEALKDCLRSPCNLFAQSSDSIGRMAQVGSTKNGSNAFSSGSLKDSFVNMANGLDEALTKKMPSIFSDAATGITQSIQQARTNIQEIAAGKKNLNELISLANQSGSMRGTKDVYRYTPDLKSYSDFNSIGYNILLKIKQKTGGCFDRYQHNYRYNPFNDNKSVPSSITQSQYNGKPYDVAPNGVIASTPPTIESLNVEPTPENVKKSDKSIVLPRDIDTPENIYISSAVSIDGKAGGTGNYSVFGGSIIDLNGITYIIVDDFGATHHDIDTLNGKGLNGGQIMIGPSYPLAGTNSASIASVQKAIKRELGDGAGFLNKYSQNYRSRVDDESMEQLYQPNYGEEGNVINEGVAVSQDLLKLLTGKGFGGFGFGRLARQNKIWVAAKYKDNPWKLYKIVDANTQSKLNVDFTPAAYYNLFGALPIGRKPGFYKANQQLFANSNIQISIGQHFIDSPPQFRIVTGDDPQQIKDILNA